MTKQVLTQIKDNVLTIQLNRPEKKNAINLEMYQALADALQSAGDDNSVRVVLIKGTKDCFSAGNDLMDFLNNPPEDKSSPPYLFLENIHRFKKPIVAAVNGPAIGIGVTMLLHCDLIYAGEGSRFQLPFVNLGITPEAGSTFLLPKLIGYRRSAEILFSGEFFDARKAYDFGLVNQLCPDDEVEDTAMKKALRLAEQPPNALCATKSLLKQDEREKIMDVIDKEGELFTELIKGPETKEIIEAFLESRKPKFS